MPNEYSEKLKDPRWQKKRLQIMERDGWACRLCEDNQSTLAVHHRDYLPGRNPWDYPDNLLITLCEHCHEEEMERRGIEDRLIHSLRENLFSNELFLLTDAITSLPELTQPDLFMFVETIRWMATDPVIREELSVRCWHRMHNADDGQDRG